MNKKILQLLLFCAASFGFAAPVLADGFIWTDENGNLWFCDQGGSNCVPLDWSEPPIDP